MNEILQDLGISSASLTTAAMLIGLCLVVLLIATVFWIAELIDVARREFPQPVMKVVWLLILIFSHGIGALLYWLIGRKQGYLPGEAPRTL